MCGNAATPTTPTPTGGAGRACAATYATTGQRTGGYQASATAEATP